MAKIYKYREMKREMLNYFFFFFGHNHKDLFSDSVCEQGLLSIVGRDFIEFIFVVGPKREEKQMLFVDIFI